MIRIVGLAIIASIMMSNLLWAADLTIGNFLATAKYDGALDHQDEKLEFLNSSSPPSVVVVTQVQG